MNIYRCMGLAATMASMRRKTTVITCFARVLFLQSLSRLIVKSVSRISWSVTEESV